MDTLEIKHRNCLLVVNDPDHDEEFVISIENSWNEETLMCISKDEAKQLIEFLQKHI